MGMPYWPHSWNWDKIDAFLASFQRPYATYVCATAIAAACFNPTTAVIALPIAGGIVGGNIAARTVEKVKAGKNDLEAKRIDAAAAPQGDQ
jgi:hypothetical protein